MKHNIVKAAITLGISVVLFHTSLLGGERWDEWNRTFGGPYVDQGYCVQRTWDLGYIICGRTSSYGIGGYDVWLIKTDSSGNKQWDRTFGNSIYDDVAHSVQETKDGGFVITGYTCSPYDPANTFVWLIKTDKHGIIQWDKIFGGVSPDGGMSVWQTLDYGYIIAGYTKSFGAGDTDFWLIKTDGYGTKLWDKTFGGLYADKAYCVQETVDDPLSADPDPTGYIITGVTSHEPYGPADMWVIRTDLWGNLLWQKTFGGSGIDQGYWVVQTMDVGYIITGYTTPAGSYNSDLWLIKLDYWGNQLWSRTFGGPSWEYGFCVRETIQDAGYIVAGSTASYGAGDLDFYIVKTDYYGNMQWYRTYGGAGLDRGRCVVQDEDDFNDYAVLGDTQSFGAGSVDIWLVHTSPVSLWCNAYTVPQGGGSVTFQLDAGSENGFRNYFLLGGITGTEPGTSLPGGTTLLLNWDPYTDILLSFANTPMFSDFMGKLDASGQATAQLNVPPVPGYAGLVMFYAYTLFSPFGYASNAITMTVVP